MLAEVFSQKAWMLELFRALCAEAGFKPGTGLPETLMLLLEGALVSIAMQTFTDPISTARTAALNALQIAPRNI